MFKGGPSIGKAPGSFILGISGEGLSYGLLAMLSPYMSQKMKVHISVTCKDIIHLSLDRIHLKFIF